VIVRPPERLPGAFSASYRALSVGVVALIMLIAFEYLAVATAMPIVARSLDGLSLYGLAFSGSMAASVIATVLGGRWSDVRGPEAPLWTGVAAFMVGLVVAGSARSMETLIAGRVLQGLGGGLFAVSLYVLVARVYPAELHPRVFSLLAAAWVVPSMIGPTITGLVVVGVGWRWVFLGIPLFAAPAAFLLWRGLAAQKRPPAWSFGRSSSDSRPAPDSEPATGTENDSGSAGAGRPEGAVSLAARLSWAVAAAVGAALMQYGGGLRSGTGLALLAGGLVVLAVALPRLLPPGTLRAARGLPTVVALRGLAAGAFFAAEVFVPLMLTTERGLSPAQAGLALTGGALAWSFGSWIQGRRPGRRVRVLRLGTALIAGGVAVMALTVFHTVPVPVGFAAWAVGGLGIGLVYPTLSVLVLELSPPGEQGANSSSLQIGESIFSVVAVAVTGAIFAALGPAHAVYLTCFGVIAVVAATGTVIAGRFEQPQLAGTMEGDA
jgi:MFS family permease